MTFSLSFCSRRCRASVHVRTPLSLVVKGQRLFPVKSEQPMRSAPNSRNKSIAARPEDGRSPPNCSDRSSERDIGYSTGYRLFAGMHSLCGSVSATAKATRSPETLLRVQRREVTKSQDVRSRSLYRFSLTTRSKEPISLPNALSKRNCVLPTMATLLPSTFDLSMDNRAHATSSL